MADVSGYSVNKSFSASSSHIKFDTQLSKGKDSKTATIALKKFENPTTLLGKIGAALQGRVTVKSDSGNEYIVKTSHIAKALGIGWFEARALAKEGAAALAEAAENKARIDLAKEKIGAAIKSDEYSIDKLIKDNKGLLGKEDAKSFWQKAIIEYASENKVPKNFAENMYKGESNKGLQKDFLFHMGMNDVGF